MHPIKVSFIDSDDIDIKMNENFKSIEPALDKYIIGPFILLLFIAVLLASGCDRAETKKEQIYGKYRAYSEDPRDQRFLAAEDNYLEIKADKIVYQTTINQKPKFYFEGRYQLNSKTLELEIEWKEGKLPKKLKIEKDSENLFIKIGNTFYIR